MDLGTFQSHSQNHVVEQAASTVAVTSMRVVGALLRPAQQLGLLVRFAMLGVPVSVRTRLSQRKRCRGPSDAVCQHLAEYSVCRPASQLRPLTKSTREQPLSASQPGHSPLGTRGVLRVCVSE